MIGIIKRCILVGALSVLSFTCVLGLTSCSNKNYVNNTHDISENFSNIFIDTKAADVIVLPSPDGKCRVECYEKKNTQHAVSVSDDTLNISWKDGRKWYQKIFNTGRVKVTVYLPVQTYNSIVINNTTGDVRVENISAGSLTIDATTGDVSVLNVKSDGNISVDVTTGDINVSRVESKGNISFVTTTGNTKMSDVSCRDLTINGTTGDVTLSKTVALERLSIDVSTGDVIFDSCDAAEIYVESTTGDVKGSFLTDKIIFAKTTTGKISVPKSTVGGRCEIETTTGDIDISIE